MARLVVLVAALVLGCGLEVAGARTVRDALGREVAVPDTVERFICSGAGCLRLAVYLRIQHGVVAVDDIEARTTALDARPYALANPQFKGMPVFGQFRGQDDPERILALSPQPQVIFKTMATMGHDPVELQAKTGIPVVVLDTGNLGAGRQRLAAALRLMAEVTGTGPRAEAVIAFLEETIADLAARTADLPEASRPTAYVGGVAYRGPHGLVSTEPGYPPFAFVGARNVAAGAPAGGEASATMVSKEQLLAWDPAYVFVDLATLQLGEGAGALHELRTDPLLAGLSAVRSGRVFGVLPYNWYGQNFESILANAYFVGTVLFPERFQDVDPAAKADAIFAALVGKPVFGAMNAAFGGLAFTRLAVR